MFLLTFFVSSKAQEAVTLTFTANTTQGSMYCPFDAVNVTNVTRGWTETLAYPDTVLLLNSTVGLGEQFGATFRLGEAHPNPFTDETVISLETSVTGEVCIQVFRIDGTVIVKSHNHLEAGTHKVRVSLHSPGMSFLVATSAQGRQVVRLLCTGNGGGDHIIVEPVSREYTPSGQFMRGDAMGEFQPGDMMRYTGVLYDGANTIYSNTITQQQFESQIVTLYFDLTIPEVTTNQVIDITQTTAIGVGDVVATGGVSVTERGICWSTSHNPDTNGSHASNGTGSGTYTVQMNGLTVGTTYYVRAYAINLFGTAYGNEVSFTTTQIPSYSISVSANPTNGGTVSGGGSYQEGQNCTVIATAANGYSFNDWTENGNVVSTNPNYSFTVNNSRDLVANFSVQAPNTYTINASPNPSDGGVVTGGGTYQQGQSCTVSASANTGYSFLQWTENGTQVSSNANYTFTVTCNRTLIAQFQLQDFTISATVTPDNSGTVTGGGSYNYGQTCTLMATANTGYVFEKWTKDGEQVSTEVTYSFTVTESASYVAHFQLQNYTINVSANPTNGGSVAGAGSYSYGQSCTLTATANTGYTFLRWTENGNQVSTNASYTFSVTDNRFLVAQFQEQSYTITASANPSNGGSVTGGGSYNYGQSCTVVATSAAGFTFTNWTDNGSVVSTNTNYTFTVNANRTLVANFSVQAPNTYSISVSSNPSNGGSVTGGGTYQQGQSCTVSATAATGFTFTNWTENGNQVSTNPSYTFTVSSNRALVANFTYNGGGNTPTGAINGLFSVSATQQVYFSQGNLQYQASSNNWRFATNQYDYVGSANSNISQTYNGWIDLFGWGTSGYNHGAVCYQPWSTSQAETDYYAYGSSTCNLYDQTGQADWGYNAISNGGNLTNQWRTLTTNEWQYVFNTRSTSSGLRYAKAKVNNVNGVILLPDNWSSSTYSLSNTNQGGASYSSNTISTSQWSVLENAGAVFLPAAGYRDGSSVFNVGSCGYYWSSSSGSAWAALSVSFFDISLYLDGGGSRYHGQTVRLVHNNSDLPTVTTNTITNITQTTATGGGNVTTAGSSTVTARGVCWSTSHNPTVSGNHTTNGTGTGSFTSNITGLTANTTYYVRAYAMNSAGTAYGGEVSFTTSSTSTYTISVSANPNNGGSVTGGGTYQQGQSCTVTATANSGYTFVNWTENGSVVSTNASYTFTVTGNRTLVANFSEQAPSTCTISVSSNPTNGGTILGGGIYYYGVLCSLTADAATGYIFTSWTENGSVVSTNTNYTFTVNGDRTLVANFEARPLWQNGVLPGVFSVSANQQVYFSQGNLQYIAKPQQHWRFADNQYDYVGSDNSNISQTYNSWIDLFGWGTSGYNHGAVCYQPWSTSQTYSDYYAYGNQEANLYDSTGKADWGYNYISNGGNQINQWRTLTTDEWQYVFNTRTTSSGLRYAKAKVNNVNGVILLPDNWSSSIYSLSNTNQGGASYSSNIISVSQWITLETAGAVFLPAAGKRQGISVDNVGSAGYYWSASAEIGIAYGLFFQSGYLVPQRYEQRYEGHSVRLVKDVYTINVSANPTNGGTVSGGGMYEPNQSCTVSATAATGYTFYGWTENGNVVSTNANYTFTVTSSRTLVANFIPSGTINGLFSVSDTQQVYFSQGNLQYIGSASTPYWKFADNQWDYLGMTTGQNSTSINVDRDLFGWGTSGYHDPDDMWNVYYQPWSTSYSNAGHPYYNDYGYGPSTNMASPDLTGSSSNYDWGVYNPIINGGNTTGLWRTMTVTEWNYVINTRTTSSGKRYAKAQVNSINGLILLPDDWDNSYYSLNGTNDPGEYFNSNVINSTQWITLEQHGAVFLPAAGCRYGTSVDNVGSAGYYWTASCYSHGSSYRRIFDVNGSFASTSYDRCYGYSVRLVHDY